MIVLSFQMQMRTHPSVSMTEFLRRIDSRAPRPDPLEGGDGQGPLYLCVLDATKCTDLFNAIVESEFAFKLYGPTEAFEVEISLYAATSYVESRWGKHPILRKEIH